MFDSSLPPLRARRAHRDDRAAARQVVRLGDEVELPADAADDAAVLEAVRDDRAAERRHHRGIDEARIAPLRDLRLPVRAEQLVREADRHHAKQRALLVRHGAQFLVERARPEQEGAVQQRAVRSGAPLQDAFAIQVEEAVHEHLGDGIEALRRTAHRRRSPAARRRSAAAARCPRARAASRRCCGGAASARARSHRRARRCRSGSCRRRGPAGSPRARSHAPRSGSGQFGGAISSW